MKIFNSESSNPMFNDKILDNLDLVKEEKMTVTGTVNKTLILLLITVVTAFFSWQQMLSIFSMPLMFGVMILGIILVVAGMKKPQYAHIIAPIFAFVEGLLIGVVSAMYASAFEGIVANAALLTFGTLFLMLF
ncbi:MAG: Bax inhibitor-1/YccA family protein, partial [Pelagibacterales bacterium]|nr:Bax inhibitor-1/YccA family protein [Pelagibacterales bacterium]